MASTEPKPKPSKGNPPAEPPNEDQLKQAAAAAEKALAAQSMANSLREAASSITDPKKREKMLTDAYNKEIEAHGNSKKARMFSSGAFQGGVGGAGIGGAVGAGVGTIVGTVVGGVTAIPTTLLGGVVGSGVGLAHGPFIKLGSLATGGGEKGKEGDKKEGKEKAKTEVAPDDEDAVPDPKVLRQAADALADERQKKGMDSSPLSKKSAEGNAKKKPRKIEIRSGGQPQKTK